MDHRYCLEIQGLHIPLFLGKYSHICGYRIGVWGNVSLTSMSLKCFWTGQINQVLPVRSIEVVAFGSYMFLVTLYTPIFVSSIFLQIHVGVLDPLMKVFQVECLADGIFPS